MAIQCPNCSTPIKQANLENVNIKAYPNDWSGLAYACPYCGSIMRLQIDPLALNADVLAQISAMSRQVRALADGISVILDRLDKIKKP